MIFLVHGLFPPCSPAASVPLIAARYHGRRDGNIVAALKKHASSAPKCPVPAIAAWVVDTVYTRLDRAFFSTGAR